MVATTLAIGDIAIIGYQTGQSAIAPATTDKISFVLLAPVGQDTQIFLTDRQWNGSAFVAAGGDGTITFTALSNLAAGTVVTANFSGGNVTFTVNGVTTAPVSANGFDIDHTTGDAIYVYQGSDANTPTRFLHAGEFADGNTTFNGSLVNTGLVNGYSAVAVAHDTAAYHGPTTHAESFLWNGAGSSLLHSIADPTNWVGDDAEAGTNSKEQEIQTGPWLVHADVEFWGTMSGGGGGLASTLRDPTFASGNDDYNHTRNYDGMVHTSGPLAGQSVFWSPRDIIFDTVDGKFFVVDSDITGGHNRILQGNIADLIANPSSVPSLTVLYEDVGTTTASRLDNMEVDVANNIIYFTHGSQLMKINYNTASQAGVVLFDANAQGAFTATTGNPAGSTNNFFNDMVIDFADGRIYISSTRVLAGASGDVVSKNFIYELTGLTTGSGAGAFVMNGSTNTGTARLLPFAENDLAFNPTGSTAAGSPFSAAQDPFAWALERGTLDGLAYDPVNDILYFSTGEILHDHDGSSGTAAQYAGGVIASYQIGANSAQGGANAVTILYQQTAQFGGAIPGLMGDLEIDLTNGHLYVLDYNGVNGVNDDNHWFRLNTTASTPIQFTQTVGDIQGAATVGLTLNHAPTLTGNGLAAAVTEASNAASSGETNRPLLFNGITIADVDTSTADEITGAVVRISGNFQSGATHQDFLRIQGNLSGTIAGSGISYTYNQSTGAMVLTGAATVAEYKAAIELVTFSTSGDDVTAYGAATNRTISVSVSDGLTMSDEISMTVSVTGINDAPVNTPGAAMNFTEDTTGNVGAEGVPPTPVSNAVTGISVFDVDANPATQDVTVTLAVAVGTLTIRTDVAGGITAADVISGNGTGTIVITATQNQINTTLAAMSPAFTGPPAVAAAPNGLIYTAPANFNGATNLTITTNDNGFNGNDPGLTGTGTSEQDQDVKVLNVADVNDAPTVGGDGTESAADILEDVPFTDANAPTVATLFGGQFADAVDIQVSGGNPTGSTGDTFAGIAIVSATSNANGAWQYWDGDSWENIGAGSQAGARTISAATQIRFNPTLNYNGPAPTLTVHLIETGGPAITNNGTVNLSPVGTATGGTTVYSSGTVVLSQTITAVNDAPVNTVGSTVNISEDATNVVLSDNVTPMSVADVEATGNIQYSLGVGNGILTIRTDVAGGITAAQITGGANGSGTIVIEATIAQINATLAASNGLLYTPNANYFGTDSLVVYTNDLGQTGTDQNPASVINATVGANSEEDFDQRTINIAAVDDLATPVNDSASVDEDDTVVIDALANDTDIDNTPVIAKIDGMAISSGGTVTLASGATVTLNGDGTLTYDPNDQFNYLISAAKAAATGAVNDDATETFTYELADGTTATVTVDVNGVDSPEDRLQGDAGPNTITGTAVGDIIDLSQGGDDTADGAGGNDGFYMGSALSAGDVLDGEGGTNDQLILQGNVTATILQNHLEDIEVISLLSGSEDRFGDTSGADYDYNITMDDAAVDPGERLKIWAAGLGPNEDLVFDGSAEMDGHFTIFAGAGTDHLIGGHGNDYFYFAEGNFTPDDRIVGNGGAQDQLGLRGDYATVPLIFQNDTITGIDTIVLISGSDPYYGLPAGPFAYDITLHDDNLIDGETMSIWAINLQPTESLTFDGSAEVGGKFNIYGGQCHDWLFGGGGADMIWGNIGGDLMMGNGGNDRFVYRSVLESDTNASAQDWIMDLTVGDVIDLSFIDADDGTAGKQDFAFIGSGMFSNTAGELRVENVGGDDWIVEADVDGDGVADLGILVTTSDSHALTIGDFML